MILQSLSIIIEAIIVVLSLFIAKRKSYGYFLALTFLVYVFYDTTNLFSWGIPAILTEILFFIASLSALTAIYIIFNEKR
jgi:hypothetical protein